MKKSTKKKKRGRYNRGVYTSTKTGQVCKFRSGWEEKVMQYLDVDPSVSFWSYEQIVIEYVSNIRSKRIRRYYPDFFVRYSDGKQQLLEVKPKRKVDQLIVRKKLEAAKLWCENKQIEFLLLTEIELKQMGLL